jgi:hypothetical protein
LGPCRMEPGRGEVFPATLRAEHLTFGKIVTGAERTVPSWSPYGITRRSSGIALVAQQALLPEALIGISALPPQSIASGTVMKGALVGRMLELPRIPDGSLLRVFAALRFRFRPESGEGTPSRLHLQARCLIFPVLAWMTGAPFILTQLGALRAEPDYAANPRDINLDDASLLLESHLVPTSFARDDVRDSIVDWAERENGPDVLELGDESIESEAEFLAALAAAYQAAPIAFSRLASFGFSAGYCDTVPGRSIRYLAGRDCNFTANDKAARINRTISTFLRWQRLLVDAALSVDGGQAHLLFEATRQVNALLAEFPDREHDAIEAVLPLRERAFLHLISAASGWRTGVTRDDLVYARDAEALINKLAQSDVWHDAKANVGKLIAA